MKSRDKPAPLEFFRENEKDEGKEGEGGEGNPSECEKKEEGVLSTVIKLQAEIPPTHCVETSHAKIFEKGVKLNFLQVKKISLNFRTIINLGLVEESRFEREKRQMGEEDLKSEKDHRLSTNHEGCRCNEYNVWWTKVRSRRGAYLFEIDPSCIIDYSLHPIFEGEEEDEGEEEYEYESIKCMITFVEMLSEFGRDTRRKTTGEQSLLGLLSKSSKICCSIEYSLSL